MSLFTTVHRVPPVKSRGFSMHAGYIRAVTSLHWSPVLNDGVNSYIEKFGFKKKSE